MIELIDIGYVRSSTPDLADSVRFAVDVVGMELSASGGTAPPICAATPASTVWRSSRARRASWPPACWSATWMRSPTPSGSSSSPGWR